MKVTAVYMKFDANPFRQQPDDYKRVAGIVSDELSEDLIKSYAKDAAPDGYVFVEIEKKEY